MTQEVLKNGKKHIECKVRQDVPKLLDEEMQSCSNKVTMPGIADVPCTCDKKGIQIIQCTQWNNKKVYVGNCIGHSINGSTTYLGIDDDGQRVVAKKWVLSPAMDIQIKNHQLILLKEEFKAAHQIENPYLVPYTAIELSPESNHTSIYVFRNYILGVSLKCLQNKCKVFDKFEGLALLRRVGLGVLNALSELHSVGVVHKDVRSENIYLEDNGGVKLVGASLDWRLCEMVENYCSRQNKGEVQDIYAAAQVLLSIVSKEISQEIPQDLPSSAKDFFYRCLTEDEHCQWSANQLIKHGFLTDDPLKSPSLKDKGNILHCPLPYYSDVEDNDGAKIARSVSTTTNVHSRINSEFEVLASLGKGAFGDVSKVRNKLDGRFYAIKHVKLNPKSVELNKKIIREVKLFSRLNHENVVRYYNAWIETITETEIEGNSVGDESSEMYTQVTSEVQILDDEKLEDDFGSSIEFEEDYMKSHSISTEELSESPRVQLKQVLCIQMEFCEKNTLRQAIDNSLYQEYSRAWRLFREILEGLAHIHGNGMIHRDLKPVNVFLDSNDHVKIGDFGLATKVLPALPLDGKIKSLDDVEESLTGLVGTTLYAAPELKKSSNKIIYNQKVDIYSLGIMLFEMFYPPFKTGTERVAVLTNLRHKNIIFPKDFVKNLKKQRQVLRLLLQHDPSLRPTSVDLLSDEIIPRVVPEKDLSSVLSHTLSKPGSSGYQRLVARCLEQQLPPGKEISFNSKVKSTPLETIRAIQECVIKVFKSHGAKEFSPPLLTPRVNRWDQIPSAVKVMTSSGTVCHLPHDLRLPFARFVAHSSVTHMRRYQVGRVYQETERKLREFHPREITQCAFDIVTVETDTLWPDAELLVVASRAAAECSLKVIIQLNHTDLLKSLLLSYGVPLDRHHIIYPVLLDVSFGRKTGLQLQTHLTTLGVSSVNIKNVLLLIKAGVSIANLQDLASRVKSDQRACVIHAVKQLNKVYDIARMLGCESTMTVAPLLVYDATQHNGVFWQMLWERQEPRPSKHRPDNLIAAGGRYNALVGEFRKFAKGRKCYTVNVNTYLVGFSMSIDQMATILHSQSVRLPYTVRGLESAVISVSEWGTADDRRDNVPLTWLSQLARGLWASGYSCVTWPASSTRALRETTASIYLMGDGFRFRAIFWDNDRFQSRFLENEDIIEFLKQLLKPGTLRSPNYGSIETWKSLALAARRLLERPLDLLCLPSEFNILKL